MELSLNELLETIYAVRDAGQANRLKSEELQGNPKAKTFFSSRADLYERIENGLWQIWHEMHENGLSHASVEVVRE